MHVDAFFEYLLGKRHTYFVDLPPPHDPLPAHGRDGVPAEEDLAIRALDPSFRPKRGRKRNESPEEEPAQMKRPLLTTSFTYEGQTLYAQPQSAHPADGIPLRARPGSNVHDTWDAGSAITPNSSTQRPLAPHSAITARPQQGLQWQLSGTQDTPNTPYPMSAIEPRTTATELEEPRSAITPSSNKTRSRRKHGPAVSSAWPSSGSSGSSKLRGRPPVNRSVQDGPFTTFPVDPNSERTPSSQRTSPNVSLGHGERSPALHQDMYTRDIGHQEGNGIAMNAKPERLQVQVPEHTGRPIRLATPTVVLNGESDDVNSTRENHMQEYHQGWQDIEVEDAKDHGGDRGQPGSHFSNGSGRENGNLGFAYEALRRTLATDLLRASVIGRQERILGPEAMRLATAILARLEVPQADSDNKSDDAARMAAASWLGVSSQLGFNGGHPCKEKEVAVRRFTMGQDGSQVQLAPDQRAEKVQEIFDVSWSLGFGGVGGRFAVVGLELEPEPVDPEDAEARAVELISEVREQSASSVDWKSKFMALDLTVRLMKGQLNRLQDRVLDAIL